MDVLFLYHCVACLSIFCWYLVLVSLSICTWQICSLRLSIFLIDCHFLGQCHSHERNSGFVHNVLGYEYILSKDFMTMQTFPKIFFFKLEIRGVSKGKWTEKSFPPSPSSKKTLNLLKTKLKSWGEFLKKTFASINF